MKIKPSTVKDIEYNIELKLTDGRWNAFICVEAIRRFNDIYKCNKLVERYKYKCLKN